MRQTTKCFGDVLQVGAEIFDDLDGHVFSVGWWARLTARASSSVAASRTAPCGLSLPGRTPVTTGGSQW